MSNSSEGEAYPVTRDAGGKFVKGVSGNPAGKAKGVKNMMTLERLAFERALRQYVSEPRQADKLIKGIDRVLSIAISDKSTDKDSISAMKMLLDRVMPAMPPQAADEAEKTDTRLHIVIQTKADTKVPVEAVIVQGDYEDITEED